jgi:hypothetical protein
MVIQASATSLYLPRYAPVFASLTADQFRQTDVPNNA